MLAPADSRLSQIRHRLLCRIARRFRVITDPLDIAGVHIPFTRVVDPDAVLNDVATEADLHHRLHGRPLRDDELHMPYWAEVWDSARGMGEFLGAECRGGEVQSAECRVQNEKRGEKTHVAELKMLSKGRQAQSTADGFAPSPILHSALPSLLDLGCGMGLAGTVAAALGARVLFADLEAPALLFARLNSLPWRRRVRTRQLNWQRDRLNEQFDLILGSDILYERPQWPFLEAFWRAHLKPGGKILLGEPGRQTGDMFKSWITAQGWCLAVAQIAIPTGEKPIRIFQLCG